MNSAIDILTLVDSERLHSGHSFRVDLTLIVHLIYIISVCLSVMVFAGPLREIMCQFL